VMAAFPTQPIRGSDESTQKGEDWVCGAAGPQSTTAALRQPRAALLQSTCCIHHRDTCH
jgi:hypothetical protein